MTAQYIAREVLDQLVDGAAGVAELLPGVSASCRAEDATLALALEGVNALIVDVGNAALVEGGFSVTATPRLNALRDYALRAVSDPVQRETILEAYADISENLSDTCELIGYGLIFIGTQYLAGNCLREVLQRSMAPARAEIEAMLDRLEVLAERRQAWEGVKKALPWVGALAAVGIVSWLVFGKR